MYKVTVYILLSIITLLSCKTNVYDDIKNVQNNKLTYNDTISFDINITTINKAYNVYINIENTDNYKYSNLFLFVYITSPNNNTIIDTIDIFMADYNGKWVGKSEGENYFGNYLFKQAVVFPKKGIYKTSIVQGMRDDTLKGISKIGLSVKEL